jgi:pimeloyl-ACP methyl ester carboxylesterase
MTTAFFRAADGARLAYCDEGAGMAVLCLAGLTRTMADFDALAPHLPPCRLIRMDYRGRGQSDRTGAASYTVPVEARDALALLDHLAVARAALVGTSRGGLIGLYLAATAQPRLLGLCLIDVGPVIAPAGLARIKALLGRNPAAPTHRAQAEAMARALPGFAHVPAERWLAEARRQFAETAEGLRITYDPALREAFLAAYRDPPGDAWPQFDACAGLPLALVRGAGSDLLSRETVDDMRRRRPDMVYAEVPDRGHVPFLDEPESVAAIRSFLTRCGSGA